jgi:uncharacterized membrane-anchored protein YhcB (DUF1043 family)
MNESIMRWVLAGYGLILCIIVGGIIDLNLEVGEIQERSKVNSEVLQNVQDVSTKLEVAINKIDYLQQRQAEHQEVMEKQSDKINDLIRTQYERK